MAITSTFGYTNTSTTSRAYDDYTLGITTNYGLKEDEPDRVIVDNNRAPMDQAEIVTYQGMPIPRVNTTKYLVNNHPSGIPGGVQYVIKVEELLSTRDSATGSRIDEPIVMYLTVKHPRSGNITSTIITEVFNRLKGALMLSDGTYRWDDLMRLSMKPTQS